MKNILGFALVFIMLAQVTGSAEEHRCPLTLQLNWIPNVEFAGILVAKEHGWYEKSGIDLTVKTWEADISPIDEVLSGRAQIGVIEGSTLIQSRAEGFKIKAIAVQFQQSPACLICKKSLDMESAEAWKGKRVGVNDEASIVLTKFVLTHLGLRYEDIIPVQVGYKSVHALMNDEADIISGYITNEPFLLKEQGYDAEVIPAYKYGYDFYSGVYFVHEEMITKQPELITTFLDVTFRGWREAFQDVPATARLIMDIYAPDGSIEQQTEELKSLRLLATYGVGEHLLGMMREGVWQQGIDTLYQFGQIQENISPQELYTPELLNMIYFK